MNRNQKAAASNATRGAGGGSRGWRSPVLCPALTLVLTGWLGAVAAQEYAIGSPQRPVSAPVHLTEPVSGRVEVVNQPQVQEVRVVGGTLDRAVEVQGEVGLRLDGPLPVEWVGELPVPALTLEGPVSVIVDEPLRVWVENPPEPVVQAPPERARYAGFVFAGLFEAQQRVLRRGFAPAAGTEFLLTDLLLDARTDVRLSVRVLARAGALGGTVVGAGDGELALLVLDSRFGPSARPATAIPLSGPFTIEVAAEGAGLGAPFAVLVGGTQYPTAAGSP